MNHKFNKHKMDEAHMIVGDALTGYPQQTGLPSEPELRQKA
jgi:hypothetical protein